MSFRPPLRNEVDGNTVKKEVTGSVIKNFIAGIRRRNHLTKRIAEAKDEGRNLSYDGRELSWHKWALDELMGQYGVKESDLPDQDEKEYRKEVKKGLDNVGNI